MFMVKTVGVVAIVSVAIWTSAAAAELSGPPARRLVPRAPSIAVRPSATSVSATSPGNGAASGEDFLVSALSVYTPPACVPGVPFSDITCSTGFDSWIEQFGLDGITAGCGGGKYCPGTPVTRDQMAVFIEKSMRGTSNWPPHTVLVHHHPAGEATSWLNSGSELLAMVAAIPSTGAEAPSSSNPWLIRLGPGIWDLGTGNLLLPAYVAIEGAGEDATAIVAAGYTLVGYGTLMLSGSNDVSRLTVYNTGNATYENAIVANGNGNRLSHLAIFVQNPSNASGTGVGVYVGASSGVSIDETGIQVSNAYSNYGVESVGGFVQASHTSIGAYGSNAAGSTYGVFCSGSTAYLTVSNGSSIWVSEGTQPAAIHIDGTGGADNSIRDSLIDAYDNNTIGALDLSNSIVFVQDDDIYSWKNAVNTSSSATVEINNCRVKSGSTWITNGATAITKVGASLLAGTTSNSGTLTCGANYNGNYAALGNSCP